ncbi:hypothetical protein ACI2LF_43735 [Kribbella sp. NPDC020789]
MTNHQIRGRRLPLAFAALPSVATLVVALAWVALAGELSTALNAANPVSAWVWAPGVASIVGTALASRRMLVDADTLRGPNNRAALIFTATVAVPLWLTINRDMYAASAALTVAAVAVGVASLYLNAARALAVLPIDPRGHWYPVDERDALKQWVELEELGRFDLAQTLVGVDHPFAPVRVWALPYDRTGFPYEEAPLPLLARIGSEDNPIGYARFKPAEPYCRPDLITHA